MISCLIFPQFHIWNPTNIFYRQIANFIIDLTAVPPVNAAGGGPTGIHWPTAQVQNAIIQQFVSRQ